MRTFRYDKIKQKLRRRRSIDAEQADQADTTDADMAILKGVFFLFVGGLCVAAAVYLALLSTVGGPPAPPAPPLPPPPPPTTNNLKPGHPIWWRLLSWYDALAARVSEYRESRRLERKWKSEHYEPPQSDTMSCAVVEQWEAGETVAQQQQVQSTYVPQATEKEKKKLLKTMKRAALGPNVTVVGGSDDGDDGDGGGDDNNSTSALQTPSLKLHSKKRRN